MKKILKSYDIHGDIRRNLKAYTTYKGYAIDIYNSPRLYIIPMDDHYLTFHTESEAEQWITQHILETEGEQLSLFD